MTVTVYALILLSARKKGGSFLSSLKYFQTIRILCLGGNDYEKENDDNNFDL